MSIKLTSVRSRYLTGARSALLDDDIYTDVKSALIDSEETDVDIVESDDKEAVADACDKQEVLNTEADDVCDSDVKELEDIFCSAFDKRAKFLK